MHPIGKPLLSLYSQVVRFPYTARELYTMEEFVALARDRMAAHLEHLTRGPDLGRHKALRWREVSCESWSSILLSASAASQPVSSSRPGIFRRARLFYNPELRCWEPPCEFDPEKQAAYVDTVFAGSFASGRAGGSLPCLKAPDVPAPFKGLWLSSVARLPAQFGYFVYKHRHIWELTFLFLCHGVAGGEKTATRRTNSHTMRPAFPA